MQRRHAHHAPPPPQALSFLKAQGVIQPYLQSSHVGITHKGHPVLQNLVGALTCRISAGDTGGAAKLSAPARDVVAAAAAATSGEVPDSAAALARFPPLCMLAPEVLTGVLQSWEGGADQPVDVSAQASFLAGQLLHRIVSGRPPLPEYPWRYLTGGGGGQGPQSLTYEVGWLNQLPSHIPPHLASTVAHLLAPMPSQRMPIEVAVRTFAQMGAAGIGVPPPLPLVARLLLLTVQPTVTPVADIPVGSDCPRGAAAVLHAAPPVRIPVPVWPSDSVGAVAQRAAHLAGYSCGIHRPDVRLVLPAAPSAALDDALGTVADVVFSRPACFTGPGSLAAADLAPLPHCSVGVVYINAPLLSACAAKEGRDEPQAASQGPQEAPTASPGADSTAYTPAVSDGLGAFGAGSVEGGLSGGMYLGLGGVSGMFGDLGSGFGSALLAPDMESMLRQAGTAAVPPGLPGADPPKTFTVTPGPPLTGFMESFTPPDFPASALEAPSTGEDATEEIVVTAFHPSQLPPALQPTTSSPPPEQDKPAPAASGGWASVAKRAAERSSAGEDSAPTSTGVAAAAGAEAPTARPDSHSSSAKVPPGSLGADCAWRTLPDVDMAEEVSRRCGVVVAAVKAGKTFTRLANLRDGLRDMQDRTHTRDEASLLALSAQGFLQASMAALEMGRLRDASCASFALQCLGNLAMQQEVRQEAADAGAIESVVATMQTYSSNARVLKDAVVALRHLAYENDGNKFRIVSSGAVTAVVAAMQSCPDSAQVQRQCCSAMGIFAVHSSKGDVAKQTITDAGGVAAILAAVRQHSEDPVVIAAAFKTLGTLVHLPAARDAAQADGVEELMQEVSGWADAQGSRQVQEAIRLAARRLRGSAGAGKR